MKLIDIAKYRKRREKDKKQKLDSFSTPLERCISCGNMTDVPINTPIKDRACYVPGAGQLCEKCCVELYGTRDLRSLEGFGC